MDRLLYARRGKIQRQLEERSFRFSRGFRHTQLIFLHVWNGYFDIRKARPFARTGDDSLICSQLRDKNSSVVTVLSECSGAV